MYSLLYELIYAIANYDWKYLINYFQKYGLLLNVDNLTKEALILYFADFTPFYRLSNVQIDTMHFELRSILSYMKSKYGGNNYTRQSLQHQIFNYEVTIQDLKNQAFDYKKKVSVLDPTRDIYTFEKYTNAWGEIQQQINRLQSQLKELKKQL